jgi:N-acetylglutamate synthase-like GNAT family acetyltransferase
MATSYALRAANDGDAEAISQVILSALRETNAKDYPAAIIARLEKNFSAAAVLDSMHKQQVFVAVSGRRIVATASLDGKVVRAVFVSPDAQGQGLGRRLMAEIEKTARGAGVTTLVVQSSVTAEMFYAKLGFAAVRDSYYGEERTIIMERHLAPI